jgi:hypothetical protein
VLVIVSNELKCDMTKITGTPAIVDIPDVNGAFVGNTMRPFTREEFGKLKAILTKKRRRSGKFVVTSVCPEIPVFEKKIEVE